jgi:hypothetical protein
MRNCRLFTVTPAAASFATPYSSADVIGGVNTVTDVVDFRSAGCKLISLSVLDAANQKSALDIYFFSDLPATTVGDDNAAYVLVDSDLAKLIGHIHVTAADYVSSSTTNAEVTYNNIQMVLQPAVKSRNIYVLVVSRGTPTYGSATDLLVRLGIENY